MNALFSAFQRHPMSVGETYFEHARFAGAFGVKLLVAAFAAFVHAVLPFAFEKTASNKVRELFALIDGRGSGAA